jgi:hypothetical protein
MITISVLIMLAIIGFVSGLALVAPMTTTRPQRYTARTPDAVRGFACSFPVLTGRVARRTSAERLLSVSIRHGVEA